MSNHRKSTLASLDGKKAISAREFDRLFDEGSDRIDEFVDWTTVQIHSPPPKKPITLRVDADVLAWFKSLGKGYQTRMNAVLRRYKQARDQS